MSLFAGRAPLSGNSRQGDMAATIKSGSAQYLLAGAAVRAMGRMVEGVLCVVSVGTAAVLRPACRGRTFPGAGGAGGGRMLMADGLAPARSRVLTRARRRHVYSRREGGIALRGCSREKRRTDVGTTLVRRF